MDENNLRVQGLSHCYLDTHQDLFSNVALGLLARAIGYNLRIAYFNKKKNTFPIVDFFYKFYLKTLDFFPYDSFEIKILESHDLLIFDNFSLDYMNLNDLIKLLKDKSSITEVVVVCNNKDDFNKIKSKFDLVSEYSYKENKKGKVNLSCIYGNGKGKSTYSFGYILRKLMNEDQVKLIYFDKGGNFYGEKMFFDKLKYIYRKFQFYSFGTERFNGKTFRFENSKEDFLEAKYALGEVHRSYDEHVIVAEEINTCIKSGLLKENEIINDLNSLDNEMLITGRCESLGLLNLCSKIIEVKEIKHYCKKGFGVRKGIDF